MSSDRSDRADIALLTTPIRIGGQRAVNRIAMAPMTNKQSYADGRLSNAEIDWLGMRADGGFGLVITGAYAVAPEGRTWYGQGALYDKRHLVPLARLARRIAATDALGIVQLIHAGSRCTREITHGAGISASDGPDWAAASRGDIEGIVEAHRVAALRVQEAGLHGIEIHGAHGFLPAQFISATDNRRTDDWGGDVAGRARLLRELVSTIRHAVADTFIVGVRLSPEDDKHGILLSETARISGWLADDGVDYVHLSLGDALAPSAQDPARHPVQVVRATVPRSLPIIAAGRIWTPQDAAQVLGHGADVVALGNAAIFDPTWPRHAADPAWSPTRPPFTPRQLEQVGVTAPFLEYLREEWPDSVADETPAAPTAARPRG